MQQIIIDYEQQRKKNSYSNLVHLHDQTKNKKKKESLQQKLYNLNIITKY